MVASMPLTPDDVKFTAREWGVGHGANLLLHSQPGLLALPILGGQHIARSATDKCPCAITICFKGPEMVRSRGT